MRSFIVRHLPILIPVILLSYANLVMKWQVDKAPPLSDADGILNFTVNVLRSAWVLSALLAVVLAGATWIVALKSFDISYAYPFISLSFFFVTLGGAMLLNEKLSPIALVGLLFIIIGVGLTAKSR